MILIAVIFLLPYLRIDVLGTVMYPVINTLFNLLAGVHG
jgi:hypothetical protein